MTDLKADYTQEDFNNKHEEPRVVCCYIVYNEQKYLWYSLDSIYDFADRIVVIDGSPDGPSTDGTRDIVMEFANKKESKVVYESGVYQNKESQRNAYLKFAPCDEFDWVFVVDGDEVYKPDDLEDLYQCMKIKNIVSIHFHHIHFWREFGVVNTGGAWDNYLYRVNRNIRGRYYRIHNSLADKNGKSLDTYQNRYIAKKCVCYHYGHVVGADKEREKALYYARRGDYKHVGVATEEQCQAYADSFVHNWIHLREPGMIEFEGTHPEKVALAIEQGRLKP